MRSSVRRQLPPRFILDRTFLASAGYDLVPALSLSTEERALLGGLADEPSCFGVLRPRQESAGRKSVKAICRETARLWSALEYAATLPDWAVETGGEDTNGAIAQLVIDGVLEMAEGDSFISGPAASEFLFPGEPDKNDEQGYLGELSRRALQYGQQLGIDSASALCARLYQYGSIPLSTKWLQRFDNERQTVSEIDAGPEWNFVDCEGWLAWRSRNQTLHLPDTDITYKLYLSPRPEYSIEAARVLAKTAQEHNAHHFKVGKNAIGLLRPDKIVAYFARRENLAAAADSLEKDLQGVTAHGVPFTAGLTTDGLLSWGADPPSAGDSAAWFRGESWRVWLCKTLAASIINARRTPGISTEPWRLALDRIRLQGVDPVSWTPRFGSVFCEGPRPHGHGSVTEPRASALEEGGRRRTGSHGHGSVTEPRASASVLPTG